MALEDGTDFGLFGSLFGGGMMNGGAGAMMQPPGAMTGLLPGGMDIEELRRKLMERMQAKQAAQPEGVQAPQVSLPAPDAKGPDAPPQAQQQATPEMPDLTGQAPQDQVAGLRDGKRAMDALSGIAGATTNSPRGAAMIQKYLKDGGVGLNPQELAWCAAAVNSSMAQAGVKGTGSNMAKSFLNWGSPIDKPEPGDLAVFSRGNANGPLGHVGFFNGYDDNGNIRVFGGNQSSGVNESAMPASRLLAFRRAPDATDDPIGSVLASRPQPDAKPMQVASADKSFVPASASTQPPQPQRRGMLDSLFGSLAPDMGAGAAPDASGGANALQPFLQALALSMISSPRNNMFQNMPQLMMSLSKQRTDAANTAYQRGKDDRDFKFREQEAKTAHENTNRGFDFQVWQAGAPQRVTTADGSVVELPGRVFPGAPGASQQPTQLVPQPQVTPAQPEAQAAPPMPTPRPSLLDPTPSQQAGGIPGASPAAPPPVVATDQPKPQLQLPPGARVLVPGQKTIEPTDVIKNFNAAKREGSFTGNLTEWIKQEAEWKKPQQNTTINNSVNPILKGLGEQFTASADDARNAADTIRTVNTARSQLDGDSGVITGAMANDRLALQKLGSLMGVADPSSIQNTESFRAAIKPVILSTVKGLGAGSGISNADREFAEKAAGGDITLDEGTIRRVLDITERAARAKIQRHNSLSDQMLEAQPDLKNMSPMMRVQEPEAYKRAVSPSPRPTATGPNGQRLILSEDGKSWVPAQ